MNPARGHFVLNCLPRSQLNQQCLGLQNHASVGKLRLRSLHWILSVSFFVFFSLFLSAGHGTEHHYYHYIVIITIFIITSSLYVRLHQRFDQESCD